MVHEACRHSAGVNDHGDRSPTGWAPTGKRNCMATGRPQGGLLQASVTVFLWAPTLWATDRESPRAGPRPPWPVTFVESQGRHGPKAQLVKRNGNTSGEEK